MIRIVEGNILEAQESIIAHQVNCQGKMNSGVAKSIRGKYPSVYEYYMKMFERYNDINLREELLGKIQLISVKQDKFVANLFSQYNYGYDGKKYTNDLMLFEALKQLRQTAEANDLSVALPYAIGCFRGGGDWSVVEGYILKAFEGYEVTLYKLDLG